MGNEIEVTRQIQAPADTVWGLISDVTRMGTWSPETTSCTWLRGATGPTTGARFKGTNRHGTKQWSTVCTVTAAEPGRHFAFRVDVGLIKVAEWAYRIEPTASGCTVRESWTDRRSGLIKKLGNKLSGVDDRAEHNRAGMETTLERLAAAAEATATAPTAESA